MAKHSDLVTTNIHIPYAFSYANAGARTGAVGMVAADVGKFARQTDDNSIWILTATTPTWVAVGGGGAVVVGNIDAEASTDGQVITSDGAGNAGWEDPTGGAGGTDILMVQIFT